MALGESRKVVADTIDFVCTAAAERGGILTATSGSVAAYNTNIGTIPSGIVPIGILLEDVESMNYMVHPQYYQRNVSDIGSKVGIATIGEFYTDFIDPYAAPHCDAGDVAYLTHSGKITTREFAPGVQGSNGPNIAESGIKIGRFMSSIDSNGFAKVWINIVQ